MKPREVRQAHIILLILLAGLAQALWFISRNAACPTYVNDLFEVSGYLRGFSHSLGEGILYPRWLGTLLAGAGAPVFVYYPPLAFYLSSLFTLPDGVDPNFILQTGIAMGAAIAFASLTAFFWAKRHTSLPAAGLISLLLAALPCQFTAMHLRISLAQLWAQGFFPLGLIAIEQWHAQKHPRALVSLTLILAAILMTHAPSALLFWPVLLLYGSARKPVLKNGACMFAAAIAALALGSIYLLPLLANADAIRTEGYLNAIADYRAVFLPPPDLLLFFLPKIFMEALPFFLLALLTLLGAPQSRAGVVAAGILASAYLCLPISIPLWQHLPLLQAPFRLLALYFVLSPLLLLTLYRRFSLPVFLAVVCIAFLPGWWITMEDYTLRQTISHSAQARQIMRANEAAGNTAPEYVTRWMPQETPPGYFAKLKAMPWASVTQGSVAIKSWQDESILLHVTTPAPATLQLKQHFFPGWQAGANNAALAITPDEKGLMRMDVPAGDYKLAITFSGLEGETPAMLISLLTLAGLLVLWTIGGAAKERKA